MSYKICPVCHHGVYRSKKYHSKCNPYKRKKRYCLTCHKLIGRWKDYCTKHLRIQKLKVRREYNKRNYFNLKEREIMDIDRELICKKHKPPDLAEYYNVVI